MCVVRYTESTIVEIKERGLTRHKAHQYRQSTIVEIKERGLTERWLAIFRRSTIVEIKERGLTRILCLQRPVIYNSRN